MKRRRYNQITESDGKGASGVEITAEQVGILMGSLLWEDGREMEELSKGWKKHTRRHPDTSTLPGIKGGDPAIIEEFESNQMFTCT